MTQDKLPIPSKDVPARGSDEHVAQEKEFWDGEVEFFEQRAAQNSKDVLRDEPSAKHNCACGGTSSYFNFHSEESCGVEPKLSPVPPSEGFAMDNDRTKRMNRAADDAGFPIPICPKCNLPLNADHSHRTYEEHDACRNAPSEGLIKEAEETMEEVKSLTVRKLTRSPGYCPFCGRDIWGEGWNPETGTRYFSHVTQEDSERCCWEIEIQGPPRSLAPVEATGSETPAEVMQADDGKYFVYIPCGIEIADCHNEKIANWICTEWNKFPPTL